MKSKLTERLIETLPTPLPLGLSPDTPNLRRLINGTLLLVKKGEDPQTAFDKLCKMNHYDGNSPFVVADRKRMAIALKDEYGINVK